MLQGTAQAFFFALIGAPYNPHGGAYLPIWPATTEIDVMRGIENASKK
jgi:hypothetical protein